MSADGDVTRWRHRDVNKLRLGLFLLFYLSYLCLGAGIFVAIEGPHEIDMRDELIALRQDFLTNTSSCITDADLEEFIVKIVQATNHGISAVGNVTSSNPNWSFGQSLFFAGTVITTIGYGRVTPLSEAGKGFCVLYAVMGIPLTLVMFTALVERLMIPTSVLLQFMFKQLGHLYKVFHIQVMHLCLIIVFVLIFFFLIPAGIYVSLEPKWDYLDAFYYCFISLTTIGLGDYIPGDSPNQPLRPLYKVATTCYLLIGLVFMMLMLAVLYEIPELNIGFHFYMKSDTDENERLRLHTSATAAGQKYTKQIDEEGPSAPIESESIPSFPRPQAGYQSSEHSLQK